MHAKSGNTSHPGHRRPGFGSGPSDGRICGESERGSARGAERLSHRLADLRRHPREPCLGRGDPHPDGDGRDLLREQPAARRRGLPPGERPPCHGGTRARDRRTYAQPPRAREAQRTRTVPRDLPRPRRTSLPGPLRPLARLSFQQLQPLDLPDRGGLRLHLGPGGGGDHGTRLLRDVPACGNPPSAGALPPPDLPLVPEKEGRRDPDRGDRGGRGRRLVDLRLSRHLRRKMLHLLHPTRGLPHARRLDECPENPHPNRLGGALRQWAAGRPLQRRRRRWRLRRRGQLPGPLESGPGGRRRRRSGRRVSGPAGARSRGTFDRRGNWRRLQRAGHRPGGLVRAARRPLGPLRPSSPRGGRRRRFPSGRGPAERLPGPSGETSFTVGRIGVCKKARTSDSCKLEMFFGRVPPPCSYLPWRWLVLLSPPRTAFPTSPPRD